ncbi:DUF4833 domain-containing protein [Flavobacterium agricola]|uniref:DUF4833 domain-containing protein n=1 Tax=Flavobacterium agricola TaxID=2870839 RepID=A0ABY6M2J0_9FLAO|nr:DUF4833 domain-containing protein [Flavobacterium agricola]UYW01356.1 DUF4833 domain-containing protein [Flavobacterium agricola]
MKGLLTRFFLFFISFCWAQSNYPVPKAAAGQLFYIQHSASTNTYVYEVRLRDGKIDANNPIEVYRILFEERGQKANLTLTQRKLAYGYTAQKITDNNYKFSLAAEKKHFMTLVYLNGKYVVETTVNNKKIILHKMFIKIKDNTNPLKFEVDYILFYGKDLKTNKELVEKLMITN